MEKTNKKNGRVLALAVAYNARKEREDAMLLCDDDWRAARYMLIGCSQLVLWLCNRNHEKHTRNRKSIMASAFLPYT